MANRFRVTRTNHFKEAFEKAVKTGRYDVADLAKLKRHHDQEELRRNSEKAVEKEVAAARKTKADEDAKRTADAREQIAPIFAELEEQRKTVADTRATYDAAKAAHREAIAEAESTYRKIFDIASELWPDGTLPRDEWGTPTADIYAQFGYAVVDGKKLGLLKDGPSTQE